MTTPPTETNTDKKSGIGTAWLLAIAAVVCLLIVLLFVPSGHGSTNNNEIGQTTPVIPNPNPTIHKVALTTDLSNPVYLPDPLVELKDFICDIEEYDVAYDLLVNGKYWYMNIVKDQPNEIKETIRYVQWRISAQSPTKTGTMRYTVVPHK